MKKKNLWLKAFCWGSCLLFCGILTMPQMKAERILENPLDVDIYLGWDKINQDGGIITLKNEAAYAGEKGAEIQLIVANKNLNFYKDLGKDFNQLNTRFYLYLNNDLDLKNNAVTLYSPCSLDWNDWLVHCILRQEGTEFNISLVDPVVWYEPQKIKLEKNRWYCVEIETVSGSPGSLKLYLDGNEAINIPHDYNFSIGNMLLGINWGKNWPDSQVKPKGSIFIDEVVIDDSNYIGPKQ